VATLIVAGQGAAHSRFAVLLPSRFCVSSTVSSSLIMEFLPTVVFSTYMIMIAPVLIELFLNLILNRVDGVRLRVLSFSHHDRSTLQYLSGATLSLMLRTCTVGTEPY